MKKITKVLPFFFLAVMALSCVPAKKLHQAESELAQSNKQNEELQSKNEELTTTNREKTAKIDLLEKNISNLVADSVKISNELYNLKNDYTSLEDRYSELEMMQDALIKGNAKETKRILSELQKTQTELQTKEDILRELERKLNARREELNNLQSALQLKEEELTEKDRVLTEKNKKLSDLENMLAKKDSALMALKNNLINALTGYNDKGLSITYKDGKVYVSMDEKLLFKSGSYTVGDRGVQAIKDLAKVLEQNPDIKIMVEGHTDDVPYLGKGVIKNNWDLSVLRATQVTLLLTENSKIDPKRITAAGRSKYFPIEVGKTPVIRAKNRRTEIILTPNLDQIFDLIK